MIGTKKGMEVMTRIKGIRHLYKSLVMFFVNHVFVGTWFYEIKRKLLNSLGYSIGTGTKIVGPIFCTAHLSIGTECWIGKNLRVHGNGNVTIGNNCDIAPEVVFITGGHQIGDSTRRAGLGEEYIISVGDGTWIGARSTIMRNTVIGKGCVIAGCACVVKNVRNNTLVAGVPTTVIKELE